MSGSEREKPRAALRQTISAQEARDIVYAFANVLAEHSDLILDARLLPETKHRLYLAFDQHRKHYQTLRDMESTKFQQEAYDETLEQVKALRMRIADFQAIDPEDESVVAQINSGSDIKALAKQLKEGAVPEQEREDVQAYVTNAMRTFVKYHRRGMNELGLK